jgi:ubiquinone/menaquinone biosynthesis C-methylase UbiE
MYDRCLPTKATTREWRTLAQDDPFYAVAAWPGKEGGRWSAEDFYAAGLDEWKDFRRVWSGYAPFGGTCIEIGCGAGRITQGLMEDFDHVVGLDVSEDMVKLAKARVPDAEYSLVDGTEIPAEDGTANGVFTCHVLQHLEAVEDVKGYLGEALRVLQPGGTIMAHLMLADRPRPLHRRLMSESRLRLTRALGKNRGAYARVRRYRHDQVRAMFESVGFTDVTLCEFRLLDGRSNPHAFWLGRKPPRPGT